METRLLIGGEQVAGEGPGLDVENPSTQSTLATVALPSAEQVDAAIGAARAAARGWADTPGVERCELLHEVATRLRANADTLADLMTREGGKPLVENADEVGWAAAAFDYYAEMGRNFAGRVIPAIESTQLALVLKEPLGVVSLLAGAGDVGEALVGDERVDGVAFTGSVETGKRIAVRCAERVARINLEMGGKDPFIVCADVADGIDVAAKGGAWAAFLNAGQVCTSAERFYVMSEVYDDFVREFVDYTGSLVLGDPLERGTDLGPMVSARQREKVAAQVDAAVAAGAELMTGGDDGGQRTGHFYAPTVITGAPAQTDLLREETFGPVAPIVPVASLDEAIALANSTRFGLGANVYTRDLETVVRCMREIKAGTVWFNDPLTDNDAGPFGGFKQSGLGRELGQEGLEAFQETKHVHIETKIAAKSWWYPYGATA
jgi:acyl-CoA reductase-like NAD-dependent aldehyde dehydrogenase